MVYPVYPLTKQKDAVLVAGCTRIVLPKPTWTVKPAVGKRVSCGYSLDINGYRVNCYLQASICWSSPIMVDLHANDEIECIWSSGGVVREATSQQITATYASLWDTANKICAAYAAFVKARRRNRRS